MAVMLQKRDAKDAEDGDEKAKKAQAAPAPGRENIDIGAAENKQ
jgi:hypothetical protein